jgi:hypothetical protein
VSKLPTNSIERSAQMKLFKNKEQPLCSVPSCNRPAAPTVAKTHPRYPSYRRSNWIKEMYPDAEDIWCCNKCHKDNTARVHGVESAEHLTALRAGFNSVLEWRHSIHPYLWARKDYCENQDGRLGFTCTTNIFWQGMLQVDHIDGNHTNNSKENLQTLCACCHTYKTWKCEDYKTPGRKTRISS